MDIRKFITKTSKSDSRSCSNKTSSSSSSTSTISLLTNMSEEIIENREFQNILSCDSGEPVQTTESNTSNQHTVISLADIGDKNSGPVQPILNSYPKTMFGTRMRCFSSNWFEEYNFLEYSVQNDRVYCYACRHFSSCTVFQDLTIIRTVLRDWKNGKQLLNTHLQSDIHKSSMEKWINYKNSKSKGSIVAKMSTTHQIIVNENRDYLNKLCEIIKYLAKQGLALRGHYENAESLNKGNFLELCILFSKFDNFFKNKFENY